MDGCHHICVPYVEGDTRGYLTRELVRELSALPQFRYGKCDADWILNVHLSPIKEENIGYRFDDRGERGEIHRRVIPSEARARVVAEVCISEKPSGRTILGPMCVEVELDYDFDSYANASSDNIFSLGQLNDRDVARDLLTEPLYRNLAKQIVDYISHGW